MTFPSSSAFSAHQTAGVSSGLNAMRDDIQFLYDGIGATTAVTSSSASTSGTTELVLASATVTGDGSTPVIIAFSWYNINLTDAGDDFRVLLYDGDMPGSGTPLAEWVASGAFLGSGSTVVGSGSVRADDTPSAGSHTYTARLVRNSGSGTASLSATSQRRALLTVTLAN